MTTGLHLIFLRGKFRKGELRHVFSHFFFCLGFLAHSSPEQLGKFEYELSVSYSVE